MRKLNSLFSLAVLLSLLCWGQTATAQGGPKRAPSVTHQTVQKGIRTSTAKDLRDPIPAGMARIILEAHDVWQDGTGYQMLWDADHDQYGASIPEDGFWFASETIPDGLFDPFEYKVPANADASFTPANFVLDGTASVDIPAGAYDYVIINPNPNIIYIVGQGVSKGNDYVVEAGKTYHFTVQRQGSGDAASVEVTGEGSNEFAPVQNLQWSVSGQTVTLKWDAPAGKRNYVLNESFDTEVLPSGWTTIDADGDGHNWLSTINVSNTATHTGAGAMFSKSWTGRSDAKVDLNPDNYLVTPKIVIPQNGKLTYWISSQVPWTNEHYGVFLSTTGNQAANFTVKLFEETLGSGKPVFADLVKSEEAKGPPAPYQEKTIDLSAYAGQEIYLAFRHFGCTGIFRLYLDDVAVSGEGSSNDYTYTVYRDNAVVAQNLTATTYDQANVAPGQYNYCVEVKYAVGVSPKVCKDVTVPGSGEFAPVQNLTGSATGQKVTLKWDAPNGTNPNPNPNPSLSESFENGIPSSWKTIDADGDGNNWTTTPPPLNSSFSGHNGGSCVSSASYINYQGPQTPDNYLVTPELSLPNGGTLTFWVCAQDAGYASEHYAVYASSTGSDAVNFTNALLEETLTAKTVVTAPEAIRGTRIQGTWYQKTVQLPAGTKYVAFRHFDCTDFFWINLDDVEVKANAKRAELLNENFEGGGIPAGWTALDADGDGNNWGIQLNQFTRGEREALAPLRASNVAISYSSLNQGGGYLPLTPNNFLITPKVEGAKKISYKVGSPGNQSWSHDHYALCISKTGTAASDFEIIFEETMVYSQGGANFTREKDLPDGTKYVAFRHYNCTDVLAIVIDDVVITGDGGSSADYTYTVYRDGTKIKEGLTATTFEEDGVAVGNHEYCVEVKYQAGVSPKVCKDVTVVNGGNEFAPVQNLTGSATGQKVMLKWDAPNGTNPNPNPNPNPSLSESFENGIPSSWKTIDADGDGNNWTTTPPPLNSSFSGHNGGSCVSSASYINYQGPQTPDNYLVTPELSLPNGGTLTFWVCAQDAAWASEHYAVYASSTGSDAVNFTNALLEETLTAKTVVTAPEAIRGTRTQGTWYQKTVQLPAGTKYVAFRHFDCTDFFWINLDDVEVKANAKGRAIEGRREVVLLSVSDAPELLRSGEAEVVLEAHDVWNDGSGYQILLDADHDQYGQVIPEGSFTLWPNCDVPADLFAPFEYTVPANADPSCSPTNMVVDGTASVNIPAGTYDYVIAAPQAGAKIWIAGQGPTKADDYVFEAGKKYHFLLQMMGMGDGAEVTISEGGGSDYTYTVYRDGTKIKEGLTVTTFEEDGVAVGNHEYCVEVKYQAGVSPKECVDVTVDPQQFNPVQNLTGSATGQKVTLKWDAPNGTNPNPNPSLSESFENGIPSSWKTIDADGDGNNWTTTPPPLNSSFSGHNGGSCVSSASYINYQGVQTPDNYLVTPELSLPGGGTLTFWVCAQDANYASEHYAVYASSTGNEAVNFTNALLEETLTAKTVVTSPEAIRGTRTQGTWYQKTVQLPAGTKYVAFRHFDCTDFFWINLDDVEVKANAKRAELLNENFEGGGIPAGWTALDADGDGNNWGIQLNQFTRGEREALAPLRASNVAISYSSLNQGGGYLPLTPNNFLITPKVEGAKKISYKVGSPGNQSWSHDHYALCISKTGTAASDFEIIFEETMVYSQGGANFTREKDLPDGTKYVAFRHYNCTDVLAIVIDDVVITGEGGTSADYTYTVYRDGTKIKEGLTVTTFEEEGVAVGNHEYCVEVKYAAGVSPKECVNVTVDPQQFNPVQNLTAEQAPNSMDAILKWNAPASKRAEVVNEGFESGIPSSWKTIDADGDGNNWTTTPPPLNSSFTGHEGGSCVSSASYINYQGAQTPDNYLVTPELSLPGGGTLTFWVCAQDANYASEHYAVYASSTGNEAVNFTNALLEETLTAKTVVTSPEAIRGTRTQGTWYQKTVQLPAGTKYVAFRHFDCTDFFWLNLDDVVITSGNAPSYTYTIYRNNTQIASGVTETTYRDPDLAAGSYTYGVKVVYPNGESAIETTTLNITSLADVTAQKPYTLTVVGKTITVSCQGEAMIYDMNGRRLAAGRNTVVYTAQGGYYAVMVVVDGKSYVEKLAVK